MRTTRTPGALTLLGAAIAAVGCGATVQSSVAPGATDLSQYKTYSFYSAASNQGQPESVADQLIHQSLRQSLAAKGFTEATNGAPDFLVAHHVKEQQQVETNMGYGWWGWGGGETYTYTEGALTVDFIDPKTNQAFWRGTASQTVKNIDSPNAQKIQKAVAKLIDKYPVNLAAVPRTSM